MSIVAIYPGTFDPLTLGHLDIIQRSARLFERVVVAVALNPSKKPLFSLEERVQLARYATATLANVQVVGFNSLLAQLALEQHAKVLIRGVRSVSDFDYERQLAQANQQLNPQLDTIFMTPNEKYAFLSSTIVKEVARHQGDITTFVTSEIHQAVLNKFAPH
ncbi:pantetheine-phosphate adenylyltransferase [Tatumella sp. TA1]|uniref:pantetheine-phosphate adenylyltransferase n=1 Tax=Rosenbergiella collisarenosi TaxID=1544695 RepID=UPI0008F93C03|nr:pantetheine-phosphate adenylyltransferase [Rosenbergiella collisarenosi]MBT0722279.1 pantetheine-phosphate adenylyltransferase [Rosenbergiella collisarenosi]QGX93026.1 pantetheine-phosphate adenylyltransferase [Tatumella sp. TA1]